MIAFFLAAGSILQEPTTEPPKDVVRDAPPLEIVGESKPERDDVRTAAKVIGLELTDAELELMSGEVLGRIEEYRRLQGIPLDNSVFPALVFDPLLPGVELRASELEPLPIALPEVERPADLEELAFADVVTLASLVRSRKVSCVELADLALARLVRLDETLHCVVSLCEERAIERAEALDAELDEGRWRGLLHGIPYGAKDLFAAKGTRTTWGAEPYETQMIDVDATVIQRLDAAGAVLVAKLSLGALAMGDVWIGGTTTRNPWKPEQGSSGSSAGSASAVAAGCVAFALGTETLGSIVSPSARCGNSSLRPTFGRVSRYGAMALSWSMDKVGPLCRSLQDAAIVFDAIEGADGLDPSARDLPFHSSAPVDVKGWRVGYEPRLFERSERAPGCAAVLEDLRAMGCELVPIELPDLPARELLLILQAEAAAAFDELTRSGRDELLARQDRDAWPNAFRSAQLIPAVEYIRANRVRTELCRAMDAVMAQVELFVHPSFGGSSLTITNLTGHPTAIAPCGFREDGTPYSICFTGQLYGETRLLALAEAWQARTAHHRRHPSL